MGLTFSDFAQAMLVLLGAGAIYLLSEKRGRVRRWGYIVGAASEPFWLYAAWTTQQWGVLLLVFWWSWFYIRGAINNWGVE